MPTSYRTTLHKYNFDTYQAVERIRIVQGQIYDIVPKKLQKSEFLPHLEVGFHRPYYHLGNRAWVSPLHTPFLEGRSIEHRAGISSRDRLLKCGTFSQWGISWRYESNLSFQSDHIFQRRRRFLGECLWKLNSFRYQWACDWGFLWFVECLDKVASRSFRRGCGSRWILGRKWSHWERRCGYIGPWKNKKSAKNLSKIS